MQIWLRFRPNALAMLASMNSAGLPTTVGSRFVEPAQASALVARVVLTVRLCALHFENPRRSHTEHRKHFRASMARPATNPQQL